MRKNKFSPDACLIQRRHVAAWLAFAIFLIFSPSSSSQTKTYKTLKKFPAGADLTGRDVGLLAGIPMARWSDGVPGGGYVKPNPRYKPLRTPDGQPDIQGIWAATTLTASQTVEASETVGQGGFFYAKTYSMVVDPSDGKIPYRPWVREIIPELKAHYISPMAGCAPPGMPRQMYYFDLQIIQSPGKVLIINEHLPNFRHIPVNDRPNISGKIKLWMGHSRGRWQGNTLVINVSNLNDKTLLSGMWDLHSDKLHVAERLTPINPDTIQYEATIEDADAYERPWTIAFPLTRLPRNYRMLEEYCAEGSSSVTTQKQLGRKMYTGFESLR